MIYTELQFCPLFFIDVNLSLTLREEHRMRVFGGAEEDVCIWSREGKVIGG
jgi:hypothetical protein